MATAQVSWLQIGTAVALTGRVSWLQVAAAPVVAAPAAPGAVAGAPSGGTTADLTLTDNSGGAAQHRWQVSVNGSGTWADAVGATNPSAAGVVSFAATGLAPATEYLVRARAEGPGGNSAYVQGVSSFWTDNTGAGGGEIPGSGAVAVSVAVSGLVGGTVAAQAAVANPAVAVQAAISGLVGGTVSALANVQAAIVAVQAAIVGAIHGSMSAAVAVAGTAPPAPSPAPAPSSSVGSVARVTRWPSKDPRESFTISFTFPDVPSEVVMNIDVYSPYGLTDPNPEVIFDGGFQVSGNQVLQHIKRDTGVDLVDYYIDCVATVAGERLVASGCLPVRTV